MPGPRSGPCVPWCSSQDVEQLPWVQQAAAKLQAQGGMPPGGLDGICGEAALAASEILYELSGRIFTGACGPQTIRPVSRPTDLDTRSIGAKLSPLGWFSSWGLSSSYGSSMPGVVAHYGGVEPPTIKLAYPVLEVLQVKIDGVIIPANEYELRDHQDLVRMRPTASFNPTQRWGWPTAQILDLPDTQQGTFSVTFTFGQPPPAAGELAARKLAEFLVLPQLGNHDHYPSRVTSVARQGVTTQVASVIDLLVKGSIGIYEVDLFLNAVNPHRLQRQSTAWSPDIGRPRRQATPSLPS